MLLCLSSSFNITFKLTHNHAWVNWYPFYSKFVFKTHFSKLLFRTLQKGLNTQPHTWHKWCVLKYFILLILLLYWNFQNQFNYFQSQSCVLKTISAVIYLAYKERTTKLVSRLLIVIWYVGKIETTTTTNKTHTWLSIRHFPIRECVYICFIFLLLFLIFFTFTFLPTFMWIRSLLRRIFHSHKYTNNDICALSHLKVKYLVYFRHVLFMWEIMEVCGNQQF